MTDNSPKLEVTTDKNIKRRVYRDCFDVVSYSLSTRVERVIFKGYL